MKPKSSDWIKEERNRFPTRELWQRAAARLRGYYNHQALIFNGRAVYKLYFSCTKSMSKFLNRCSQKISYIWDAFVRKLMFNPLSKAPSGFELVDITSKFSIEVKHKWKSRMHKSRTSSSQRSGGRQRPLFN